MNFLDASIWKEGLADFSGLKGKSPRQFVEIMMQIGQFATGRKNAGR